MSKTGKGTGAAGGGASEAAGGPDPAELSRQMAENFVEIADKSRRLVADFLARQAGSSNGEDAIGMASPMAIGAAFLRDDHADDGRPGAAGRRRRWRCGTTTCAVAAARASGFSAARRPMPVAEPAPDDRRFRDQAWSDNAVFDFIKQSYLLTARWMQGAVKHVEGLDEQTARKVDFYTRQFVDAMAPSNFVLTNPEVLRATIESGGENLVNGLKNLLDDLERGKGRLTISMTDMAAFKVGDNIAATPGKVVYPERSDAADPIRADDREGEAPAAADHPAVDQQILHPRSAAARTPSSAGR